MKKALLIFAAILTLWSVASAQTETKVKVINQEEFLALFSNDNVAKPTVFDFNATWCGPCRQLAPILEKLAEEYEGKVDFYSIDVDQNKELAKAIGIQSIPYVLFFSPENDDPEEMIGLYPEDQIRAIIEKILPTKQ
jgi:thioredoxin